MSESYKKITISALKSGALFSIGIGIGNAVAVLLFNWLNATEVYEYVPTFILYVGLVLSILAIAISGFVSGVIGGLGLPRPEVLQQEIVDHLESALAAFRGVAASLPKSTNQPHND